jgi:putative ABC transport system permease protein
MFVFPYDYARLGLYTIIAAVLAAAWPVARITLTPPAKLLKVFANEH